jgi:hypothetical protein
MKKIVLIFIMLLSVNIVHATPIKIYYTNKTDVTFAWDWTGDAVELKGFILYSHPVNSTTITKTEINDNTVRNFVWTSFPAGQFIFNLTAIDLYGNESIPSEEIQVNKKIINPNKPTILTTTNPNFVVTIPK